MKYYLIQTLSQHSISYLISTEEVVSNAAIQEAIEQGVIREYQQEFLGERIVGLQEITEDEMKKRIPIKDEEKFDQG
jgi:hypothetical protein